MENEIIKQIRSEAADIFKSSVEAVNPYHAVKRFVCVEGETREVTRVHTAIAKEIVKTGRPIPSPACIISGGETTVTIREKGTVYQPNRDEATHSEPTTSDLSPAAALPEMQGYVHRDRQSVLDGLQEQIPGPNQMGEIQSPRLHSGLHHQRVKMQHKLLSPIHIKQHLLRQATTHISGISVVL